MTQSIIVQSIDELSIYKYRIKNNLDKSMEQLREVLASDNSLKVFQILKFEKCAIEPLSGNAENLIEVINQSMTYMVSVMAVEYLFKIHPDSSFVINWGNIPGYDIESEDGTIICECFAATSYRSNGKLFADLKKLNKSSAKYKYEFFYDKEFTEQHKTYYREKYPKIQIVKFEKLFTK